MFTSVLFIVLESAADVCILREQLCAQTPSCQRQRAVFGDRLTVLTIADLLAEVILRANQGKSVGALFDE